MANYIEMMVYYTRKTAKAYLLRMCADGKEVWFPKKTVYEVDEQSNNVQTVKIADFMLEQKGYSNIGSVKREMVNAITDKRGVCVVCGGYTMKPEYKYCKEHYKGVGVLKPYNKKEYYDLYCQKCGGRTTLDKQLYREGLKCDMCGGAIDVLPAKRELVINSLSLETEYMYVYCKKCWELHTIPVDKMLGQLFKCERCGHTDYHISFEKLSEIEVNDFRENLSLEGRSI